MIGILAILLFQLIIGIIDTIVTQKSEMSVLLTTTKIRYKLQEKIFNQDYLLTLENENQDNFICIEPWNTTPRQINKLTTQDKTRDLAYGKDSAVVLEPGEVNEMQVYLHINPAYIKEMIKEIEADMQQ